MKQLVNEVSQVLHFISFVFVVSLLGRIVLLSDLTSYKYDVVTVLLKNLNDFYTPDINSKILSYQFCKFDVHGKGS